MPDRRRISIVLAALLLSTLTGCAGGPPRATGVSGPGLVSSGDGPAEDRPVSIYPAAERTSVKWPTGEYLDGTAFDPATVTGKVAVVNFWASWCAPCRAELPELNAAAEATADLGAVFLGVNVRDSRDAATSFVAGREAYPSIFDPAGRVVIGFAEVSPYTIPATVIVDRDGKIAVVLRRAVTERELVSLVRGVSSPAAPEPAPTAGGRSG